MNIDVHPVTYGAMLTSVVRHPKLFGNVVPIDGTSADVTIDLAGMKVNIRIDTNSPRDGVVVMRCTPEEFETLLSSTLIQ